MKFHTGSDSLRAAWRLNGCNSRTDGKVRMIKDYGVSYAASVCSGSRLFVFPEAFICEKGIVMKKNSKILQKIIRMTMIAMFCALAYISIFAFRIKVSFLTFEIKDSIITFAGLLFGPLASVILSFTVPLIEMLTISETQLYGFIMNSIAALSFSVTVTLTYRLIKKKYGLIIAVLLGMTVFTGVMILANLLITPYYMGVTVDDVKALIPKLLLPFNLAKAVLNSAIVVLLHTYVLKPMRKAGLAAYGRYEERESGKSSTFKIVVTVFGIVLATIAVIIFFKYLHGSISAGH